MNDTTTTAHVPSEGRRLVRPADDRVVAGVCAGLARYFDMSPLVYRVAFSVLVLLGGSGLVLYAAAWLVIPDERRAASIVEEAIRGRRGRPWLALGVGLVVLALLIGLSESRLWPDPHAFWLVVLAVGLSLVWWQLAERSERGAPAPAQGLESGPEATTVASVPAPPRRRLPVFLPTLGVVLVAAGVLGILEATDVVDVDWTIALGGAVVLVGAAVAVGAFVGGATALAALGAVLAALFLALVAADLPLHGSIGERTERPATASDIEREYEQAIGRLVVDLRDVELAPGTTRVEASVGIGELVVNVPEGVRLDVDAQVRAGEAEVLGEREDGWNVNQRRVDESVPGAPSLELDVEVGFGDLEVHRR
jgi:phage shock protein PspC (stress-responsive transcriptional regulator)